MEIEVHCALRVGEKWIQLFGGQTGYLWVERMKDLRAETKSSLSSEASELQK